MSLRSRLILLFTLAIAITVGAVAALVTLSTSRAYARVDGERSQALASQFTQQFEHERTAISEQLRQLAVSDAMLQLAVRMSRSAPDYAPFVEAAAALPAPNLDILDVLAPDGRIVSSRHWPARFGYKEEWLARAPLDSNSAGLEQIATPGGPALAMLAVAATPIAGHTFYLAGGRELGRQFLQAVQLPPGTQALLYSTAAGGEVLTSNAEVPPAAEGAVKQFARRVMASGVGSARITWNAGEAPATLRGFPLADSNGRPVAALVVASSEQELERLTGRIRWLAAWVAAGGILGGIVLSTLLAAWITRPVEELAAAADQVAAGNLVGQVDDARTDELGRLAYAFNRMTRELLEQREKLLQSERVAAWRELARRLAHELKNPLFPLQITVENLLRARQQQPQQFDEVFRESTATLLAEIENLKSIVGRFRDFSQMPSPELQPVAINPAVENALRVFEPQLRAPGRPAIALRTEFDSALNAEQIPADPELLHRALSNLVLNAVDAMPQGGELTLRTRSLDSTVRIEVADTGAGLTAEERLRLFTPYYTSKRQGSGLGLAIVQSIVSDHQGKVWVKSEPGKGSVFVLELPKVRV